MKIHLLLGAVLLTSVSTAKASATLIGVEPLRLANPSDSIKLNFSQTLENSQLLILMSPLDRPAQVTDLSLLAQQAGTTVTLDLTGTAVLPDLYLLRVFALPLSGGKVMSTELGRAVFEVAAGPDGLRDQERKVEFKLDVSTAAQLKESVSGSQGQSDRPRFRDLSLQGSISTEDRGEDWAWRAQVQLAGASYRSQATSFGSQGTDASKLDIPSYIIEGGYAYTRFSAGHINVDLHPLIYSSIGNRGVALQHKLPLGIDLGLALQSGASISGHRDLFGLSERRNQHRSLGLGYDFIPMHPGRFRVDLTASEASISSGGQPPDESRGQGARIVWRNESGSLRAEGVVARSDFSPGSTLSFSNQLGGKGSARTLEMGYDVLRDWNWRPELPISLALGVRSEYASPSYRSLGSYFSSNYRMEVVTATLKTGPAMTQVQRVHRFDNVNGDRNFIRNRVEASALNIQLPLAEFLPKLRPLQPGTSKPTAEISTNKWWPTVSYMRQLTHGFGDADFVPFGYFKADLPDIYIDNQALGMAWQFESVTVNLRASRTAQDNRQLGSEGQSTRDRRNSISVDWRPAAGLTVSLAYDPSLNYRFDSHIRNDARQVRGSVNWSPTEKWQVTLDLNHSADFDSADTRYNRQNTSQVQVSRRFEISGPQGRKLPAQAYARWSDTRGFNASIGGQTLEPGVRRLQLGMTVSLF